MSCELNLINSLTIGAVHTQHNVECPSAAAVLGQGRREEV